MPSTPNIKVVLIGKPIRAQKDAEALIGQLTRDMTNTVSEGQRFIAEYPAQLPTKYGYRRTGTLKRSWSSQVRRQSNRIEGIIGSNSRMAPYNRWVQGEEQTREMARRGWKTVKELRVQMAKDIVARVEATLHKWATSNQ